MRTGRDGFEERGFSDPARVLSRQECRRFLRIHERSPLPPMDWNKGQAATSRVFYEVSVRPEILDPVAELLGEDVVLWGASLVRRPPGKVHRIHTDIETADPASRTLSVWIGLEHTTQRSSLQLIAGSHRYGKTAQQVAAEKGRPRDEILEDDVVAWARELDPAAGLAKPDMGDGDAIWFDGRLWHGSRNTGTSVRTALLLQFAAVVTPIRIPDLARLEWPFRLLHAPRPPCILVRGRSDGTLNRIVPAPVPAGASKPALSTSLKPLELPLGEGDGAAFRPYPVFTGATPNVRNLHSHASFLEPGFCPHPPEPHDSEEVVVVLGGEVVLVTEIEGSRTTQTIKEGEVVFYPGHRPHTIIGGERRADYVIVQWRGDPRGEAELSGTVLRSFEGLEGSVHREGVRTASLFEGSTMYLGRLRCSLATLDPGAGDAPHMDAHDVAVVALEGTLETLGAKVEAPAVVFAAAGEAHGVRNVGETPARCLVLELHQAGPVAPSSGARDRAVGLLRPALGPALRRFPRLREAAIRLLGRGA